MQKNDLDDLLALVRARASLVFRASSVDHVEAQCRERVRIVSGGDVDRYRKALDETPVGSGEWNTLIDVLTVHETSFFRHEPSYEYVRANVYERAQQGAVVRAWCVGCATGEEVYSLAMLAEDVRAEQGNVWDYAILGTDVSAGCIKQSVSGVYAESRASRIPQKTAERHTRIADGSLHIDEHIRSHVRFRQHNCLNGFDVLAGGLDLIWCQNMIIYYERDQRDVILDGMIKKLRLGGLLVMAPGEAIGWKSKHADHVMDFHRVHAFRRTS